MSHTAYPVDADISTFVADAGITMPSGFVFPGYAAAASAEWEERTGWTPFLQDGSASARVFDPPGDIQQNRSAGNIFGGGRILGLRAGVQDSASLTSVVAGGVTMVSGTDYRLAPLNAPSSKRPYSRIEFAVPLWGAGSSVVVTAKWGSQAILAEDVWQALLRIGARMAVDDLVPGVRLSFTTFKQGDETFTQGDPGKVSGAWESYVDRVISRYEMVAGVI